MKVREMAKGFLIGCAVSLACGAACAGVSQERMEWFKDQKLALMMHFGLYTQPGIIESWPLSDKDAHRMRIEVERDVATNGFKEAYYALSRSMPRSLRRLVPRKRQALKSIPTQAMTGWRNTRLLSRPLQRTTFACAHTRVRTRRGGWNVP